MGAIVHLLLLGTLSLELPSVAHAASERTTVAAYWADLESVARKFYDDKVAGARALPLDPGKTHTPELEKAVADLAVDQSYNFAYGMVRCAELHGANDPARLESCTWDWYDDYAKGLLLASRIAAIEPVATAICMTKAHLMSAERRFPPFPFMERGPRPQLKDMAVFIDCMKDSI